MKVNFTSEGNLPILGISKMNYSYFDNNIERYLRFFSVEEKEEINKIKRKKKRIQTIISHLMIKKYISQEVTDFSSWNEVVILKKESGQPYILGTSLSISISHCDTYCFWGITKNNIVIGVDCENIISDRFINLTSGFILSWSVKEAFLKMLGVGFKFGIDSIEIDFSKKKIILNENYRPLFHYQKVFLDTFIVDNTLFNICRALK